jgi:hypothetical protein
MRIRAATNMPTFCAAVCRTTCISFSAADPTVNERIKGRTANSVMTAAQNKDGRRPRISVTFPKDTPARMPPIHT